MGIAGFFLWLKRWYGKCLQDLDYDGKALDGAAAAKWKGVGYDNFYIDMNGLLHPCCHDTAPLPEPESETEMLERFFNAIQRLVRVVQPRKVLVLAFDGVAPRSKLNQQRSRRFRAAADRLHTKELLAQEADLVRQENPSLPQPEFKEPWDHNQITPATAFMERVGQAVEWFVLHQINTDPLWKDLTVIYSSSDVPGEGEHKIMHFIRTLREQPGYDPNTSHLITGMDADLICLGLATHEPNFAILRNCLNENFQPDMDKYCIFSLNMFRRSLERDFSCIKNMKFERVLDDFIFLCFFVGNDFLPHMPLINIKARGIETLLDHYVRDFDTHGYLTKLGEIRYDRLAVFLQRFVKERHAELIELKKDVESRADRIYGTQAQKLQEMQNEMQNVLASLKPDGSNGQQVSNKLVSLRVKSIKETERVVLGKEPLEFHYGEQGYRDKYYKAMFGWDFDLDTADGRLSFEENVQILCLEYHRGLQWVLRYYTVGCPSWEWYYPFHYAPLLEDVARYWDNVNTSMTRSAPLAPMEQLLAVLPRESVEVLPEELHNAVLSRNSVLSRFYPETFRTDMREAVFSYNGVAQLPFINCRKLQKAVREVYTVKEDFGNTLLFVRQSGYVGRELYRLLEDHGAFADPTLPASEIPSSFTRRVLSIGGRVKPYVDAVPLRARVQCPDGGLLHFPNAAQYVTPIISNLCLTLIYEWNLISEYKQILLKGAKHHHHHHVPLLNPQGSAPGAGKEDGDERPTSRNEGSNSNGDRHRSGASSSGAPSRKRQRE